MAIIESTLKRAYLETVYWWVDCEHRYHHLFKHDKEIDDEYRSTFYEFTKKYSVRRNIKGSGYSPVFALLDKLNNLDFVSRALEGKPNLIDEIDETLPGRSIRSLLSKYATLINPLVYTMYDTRGVKSLRAYREVNRYRSYVKYLEDFNSHKKDMQERVNDTDLNYYIDLCKKQKCPCPKQIFINRLADKDLWVKQDDNAQLNIKKERDILSDS